MLKAQHAQDSFRQSYRFFRDEGMDQTEAMVSALVDMESRGHKGIGSKYAPMLELALRDDLHALAKVGCGPKRTRGNIIPFPRR